VGILCGLGIYFICWSLTIKIFQETWWNTALVAYLLVHPLLNASIHSVCGVGIPHLSQYFNQLLLESLPVLLLTFGFSLASSFNIVVEAFSILAVHMIPYWIVEE